MAVIAFGIAAAALTTGASATTIALIGAAAGLAGAFIDTSFLFPAIFGRPDTDLRGPRIDDVRLQTASEGSPINMCFGGNVRVAGTIIWISDLIEEVSTEEVGGKGGGGATVTTREYFINMAVAVCLGEITLIQRIWANGKPLAIVIDDVLLSGTQVSVLAWEGNFWVPPRAEYYSQTGSSGTVNLDELLVGKDVTITGFEDAVNNGTFVVLSKWTSSSGRTHITVTYANQVTAIPPPIFPPLIEFAQTFTFEDVPEVDDIRIYTGTPDQLPDPLIIAAAEDSNLVPAYRNLAYVVFEKLALGDYGNGIPHITFEVSRIPTEAPNDYLGYIISQIFAYANETLFSGDVSPVFRGAAYDVSTLDQSYTIDHFPLIGYTVAGITPIGEALEPLFLAGNVVVRDGPTARDAIINGTKFLHRGDQDLYIIDDAEDLGAHEQGTEAGPVIDIKIIPPSDMPDQVVVDHIDRDTDFQRTSQHARRIDVVTRNIVNVDLPMVITSEFGSATAERLLWQAWQRQSTIEIRLPPSHMAIQVTDRVKFTYNDEPYLMEVWKVSRGHNYLIVIEGPLLAIPDIIARGVIQPGVTGPTGIYIPPPTVALPLDFAALEDTQLTLPGYYVRVAAINRTAIWRGAVMYQGTNDAVPGSFTPTESLANEAIAGTCETLLGGGVNPTTWDRVNTLDIRMYHGSLSSASELDVLNGTNRLMVGIELIAFKNAILVDASNFTYRIDTFLRGQRDTMDAIETHIINEVAHLLIKTGTAFIDYNLSNIGETRYIRGVPLHGDLVDQASTTITLVGGTLRPFAPADVRGIRHTPADNDWTINWKRVTRAISRLLDIIEVPLIDGVANFEVDILDGATIVRTVVLNGLTEFIYTEADQQIDFGPVQTSLHIKIYQMSPLIGRGKPADITLTW